MIPRIFEGGACVVVAGGPSLIGFEFTRLQGLEVVAINRAHEFIPNARVLWWTDASYWRREKLSLLEHAAPYKATCHLDYRPADSLPPEVHVYQLSAARGFDPRPDHLCHGNNGAYAAMHLAAHLGARLIVLLGVDMRHGPHGWSHFHGGYGVPHHERTLTDKMLPFFGHLVRPLAERGVSVLNASPDSALVEWRRCTIDEGLDAARSWQPTQDPLGR